MKFIGKKFMKSAACFSVLCALGAGLSVSNLHASASGTSQIGASMPGGGISVDPSKLGFVPYKNNDVSWEGIQNPNTNVDVQLASKEKYCESLGIDIGTEYAEVCLSNIINGNLSNKIIENSYNQKKSTVWNNFFISNGKLLSAAANNSTIGGKTRIHYDAWMHAFANKETDCAECEFYDYDEFFGSQNFAKVKIRREDGCSTAPPGIMKYVSVERDEHGNFISATYTRSNVEINLNEQQYVRLKSAVEASALICAMRIYSQYAASGVQAFYDGAVLASKDGKKRTISVTFSDAIQGIEKEIRMRAMEIVFESGGDANNFESAQKRIERKDTIFNYKTIYASVAAQTCYQYENAARIRDGREKVIILDYGYDGLSISGAEHKNGSFTQYPTESYTNCGGKFIDDALVNYFVEKIQREKAVNEELDEKGLRARVLRSTVDVKEKLSALWANTIMLTVEGAYTDGEDYSGEYSVDELNTLLKKTGIEENFTGAINNYILNHAKELGLIDDNGAYLKGDFQIVITGGSLRIPLLKNKVTEILKYYTGDDNAEITKTLNMDECFADGAAYAGSCYDVEDIKESDSEKFTSFEENSLKWVRNLCIYNDSYNNMAKFWNAEEAFVYSCQHYYRALGYEVGTDLDQRFRKMKDEEKNNFVFTSQEIKTIAAGMLESLDELLNEKNINFVDAINAVKELSSVAKRLMEGSNKTSFFACVYDKYKERGGLTSEVIQNEVEKLRSCVAQNCSDVDDIVNKIRAKFELEDIKRTGGKFFSVYEDLAKEKAQILNTININKQYLTTYFKSFMKYLAETSKRGAFISIVKNNFANSVKGEPLKKDIAYITDDEIIDAILNIRVGDETYLEQVPGSIKNIIGGWVKFSAGENVDTLFKGFEQAGINDQNLSACLRRMFTDNGKLWLMEALYPEVENIVNSGVKTNDENINSVLQKVRKAFLAQSSTVQASVAPQTQVQQQPQMQQQAQVQQQKATGDKTLINLLQYQEGLLRNLSNNKNTLASTGKKEYLYAKYIQYSMSVLQQAIDAKEASDDVRGKVIALCGQSLSKCGEILSAAEITGDYVKDLQIIERAFSDQNELQMVTEEYIFKNCSKTFSKINDTLLNQDQKQTLETQSMALRVYGKALEILGKALSSGEYGARIAGATTSGVKTGKSKIKLIAPKHQKKFT